MPANDQKVSRVRTLYARLAALCDTGFALATHIRYTRPTLLYQTYAAKWIDHYSVKGFMLTDPTVHWGLANVGTLDWADMAAQDPGGVLEAAKTFGLANGWTYATGPATSRSLASMTSKKPFSDADRDEIRAIIDEIHALTDGFDQLPPETQDALKALG